MTFKRWFHVGLVVFAVGEIAGPHLFRADHAHFWFEDIPAWGSIIGSKLLGKLWLTRPENYYDS